MPCERIKVVTVFASVPDTPLLREKEFLKELIIANTFSDVCLLGF